SATRAARRGYGLQPRARQFEQRPHARHRAPANRMSEQSCRQRLPPRDVNCRVVSRNVHGVRRARLMSTCAHTRAVVTREGTKWTSCGGAGRRLSCIPGGLGGAEVLSYTVPSFVTMNVMTPVVRYSDQ